MQSMQLWIIKYLFASHKSNGNNALFACQFNQTKSMIQTQHFITNRVFECIHSMRADKVNLLADPMLCAVRHLG